MIMEATLARQPAAVLVCSVLGRIAESWMSALPS